MSLLEGRQAIVTGGGQGAGPEAGMITGASLPVDGGGTYLR